jgi:glucose/arabinose dehydrogenase
VNGPVKLFAVVGLVVGLVVGMAKCGGSTPNPGNPAFSLTTVATLDAPIAMATRAGDDSLYVAEWGGRIMAVRNGAVDPTPVIDLSRLTRAGGERGMLGLAIAPDGAHLYVNYTDLQGNSHVDEFALGPDGRADPASQRPLLQQVQPFPNHNGGGLAFGPDGYLYIGFGDGGSGGDPQNNAQDPSTWLGKMLRIDPSAPSGGRAYGIPADNPFVNSSHPEIWSTGLRNPWRYTFDRETGDLWIADVGQGEYEEINFSAATARRDPAKGANFGWNLYEGLHEYEGGSTAGLTMPVFEYTHTDGCSVTGGYRYRGAAVPGLQGAYLFADYCNNTIRVLSFDGTKAAEIRSQRVTPSPIVSFGEDNNGELYVLAFDGSVSRIDPPVQTG